MLTNRQKRSVGREKQKKKEEKKKGGSQRLHCSFLTESSIIDADFGVN